MTNRIAEITARCEQATPGPWEWRCSDNNPYSIEAEALTNVIYLEDDYPGYPECGEHLIMNIETSDAEFISHAREDMPYLLDHVAAVEAEKSELLQEVVKLAQESIRRDVALAKLEAEVERLREAIASVHKSLDFADSQRQSCKNYTELAINNGLALGRIAVTLKHDFKEPLPEPPEDIYKAEAEAAMKGAEHERD